MKKKKMYLDETILCFLGDESNCSCTSKPDTYTMEDLDEYDEWLDFLEEQIYMAKNGMIWILENNQKKIDEELKTLNRELQTCRIGKRKAVEWLKKNNLFNVGEKSTMEVCNS